jgi:predicted permease
MRRLLETLRQDLGFGVRQLRGNPVFTAVAVLSLALGVGANAALFQLIDAIRLRSLPLHEPQRLVEVRIADRRNATGSFTGRWSQLTNPQWERIRDVREGFAGLLAWGSARFNLEEGGEARYAQGLYVSGEYFSALGVRPLLGRVLSPSDDRRGCASPGAVISHGFWRRELGGEASPLGKTLRLDGRPFEIVGVTPASFFGVEIGWAYDVALPICAEPLFRGARSVLDKRDSWWLASLGRLAPGFTIEQATARLHAASPGIFEDTLPSNYTPADTKSYREFRLAAFPAASGFSRLRDRYETPLVLLLAIAGLVLLIACANLANLMLARMAAREREIAVRLAIGASRGRVIRQLLVESALLAGIGAAAGALVSQALSRGLVSFLSTQNNGVFVELQPDERLFAFTAGVAALTCLLFGVAPALRATRGTLGGLVQGRGTTEGRERFNLRRVLVTAQVALSLVLVVGALLFSRSLGNLTTLDAGFRQDGILVTNLDLRKARAASERPQAFQHELLQRMAAVPGVLSAAEASIVPISGSGWNERILIGGVPQQTFSNFSSISPGYFKTLAVPLLAGRDFDENDSLASPKVAIVNQSFARRILHRENPLGDSFEIEVGRGEPARRFQIVGVVKDTKYRDLREAFGPICFVPAAQQTDPGSFLQVLVRSNAPLGGLQASLKQTLAESDPAIALTFQPLSLQIGNSLLRERLLATLSGYFGVLAGLLASIGLYGVMSYRVACRRAEIGIRMALGADRGDVLSMVLREAGALLGVGLLAGTLLGLMAAQSARALLFGLEPSDAGTFAAAATALAAVAALASYLPALRASRLEPTAALRQQ